MAFSIAIACCLVMSFVICMRIVLCTLVVTASFNLLGSRTSSAKSKTCRPAYLAPPTGLIRKAIGPTITRPVSVAIPFNAAPIIAARLVAVPAAALAAALPAFHIGPKNSRVSIAINIPFAVLLNSFQCFPT